MLTHGGSKQPSVSTSAFYAIPAYAHSFSSFSNKAMKYPQENIKPYNEEESKAAQVEKMFDNIAPAYDKLNHALSWNIDKSWRRKAINLLKPFQPQRIMDVATGTGDFAIQAYHVLHPQELIGTDISEGMMNIGRAKVKQAGLEKQISFAKEDCISLSFPDHRFDAITVAFGIRNFEHLDQGLQEMHRTCTRRTFGDSGIIRTGKLPYEATICHLLENGHTYHREIPVKRPQRIYLLTSIYQSISSRRSNARNYTQSRIQPSEFQTLDPGYLHTLLRH